MIVLKRRKKLMGFIMMFTILLSSVTSVSAANSFRIGFGNNYTAPFAKKVVGVYRYDLHKCKQSGSIVYTGSFLTMPMYHTKGQSGKSQTGTYSGNISWNNTVSWNKTIGANVGISELVNIASGYGIGSAAGWAVSPGFSQSVSLSEESIKNQKTGFYAIAAGKPHYRVRWLKYNWILNKGVAAGDFYMPYGSVSSFTVRSTDHQVTWQLYQ